MLWGVILWTAILAALLLVCPALMLWGLIETSSLPEAAQEPIPETRGMTLNWLAPFYDAGCRLIGLGRSFREQTVRLHEVDGLTIPEVAKRLSLPAGTLKNWVYASRQGKLGEVGKSQKPLTGLEMELARVKRELAEVRMERDLLIPKGY